MSAFSDFQSDHRQSQTEPQDYRNALNNKLLKRTSPERRVYTDIPISDLPQNKRRYSTRTQENDQRLDSSNENQQHGLQVRTCPTGTVTAIGSASYNDNGFDNATERELALVQELGSVIEELERLKHEMDELQLENAYLRRSSKNAGISHDSLKGQDTNRSDLEKKFNQLKEEKANLEEEMKRTLLAKMTLENQLDDYRYQAENKEILDSELEAVLTEKNYFETQLRQTKAIQINLEQELRQKADERAQMVMDYEVRISTLQNDITILKSQQEGANVRRGQNIVRFQNENESLHSETNNLRSVIKSLEGQINKLRNENLEAENNFRQKLLEAETVNKNKAVLIEKEKKISESLKALIQRNEEEFTAKEEEICKVFEEKLQQLSIAESQLEQKSKIEASFVLLTAENERLHNVIAEISWELEEMKKNYNAEVFAILSNPTNAQQIVKSQHELRSHSDNVEALTPNDVSRLNNLLNTYEDRTKDFVDQISQRGRQSKLDDAEILRRTSEHGESLKRVPHDSIEPNLPKQLKPNSYYSADIRSSLSDNRFSVNDSQEHSFQKPNLLEIISSRMHSKDYSSLTHEPVEHPKKKAGLPAETDQDFEKIKKERDVLENMVNQSNVKLAEQETKIITLITEIERLEGMLGDHQDENEALNQKIKALNEVYSKQSADREKKHEQIVQQQNETNSMLKNFNREKTDLGADLQRANLKIDDLIENTTILKAELIRLQQTNITKGKEADEWKMRYNDVFRENEDLKDNIEGELRKRLTQEVDELKLKWAKDKLEYENQISQLQMSVSELQNRSTLLICENDRILKVVKDRDNEIGNWRNKLANAENEYQLQIEKIRAQLELTFKQRLDSEITNRMTQIESEKGILEKNLQNVKAKMIFYEEQITNFNRDVQLLRQELEEKNRKIKELSDNLVDHKKEIEAREQEKHKVNLEFEKAKARVQEEKTFLDNHLGVVTAKNKELEDKLNITQEEKRDLVRRNALMETKNEELKKETKKFEDNIIQKINQEAELKKTLEQENVKLIQEKSLMGIQLMELKDTKKESELKTVLLFIEIERLHEIVVEKVQEIELWKDRIIEQEAGHTVTIDELRKQFEILLQNRIDDELAEAENKFHAEKQPLDLEILKLKGQSKKQEESLLAIVNESQHLRHELNQKEIDVEQLRQKINNIKSENEEYNDNLRHDIQARLRAEFENQMKELTMKFTSERNALESEMRQLKIRITEMENQLEIAVGENEKIALDFREKCDEAERLKGVYKQLEENSAACMNELAERLQQQKDHEVEEAVNDARIDHKNEIIILKDQMQGLDNYNKDLQKRIQTNEQNIQVLNNEINKLSQENSDKVRDIDELERKCEKVYENAMSEMEEAKDMLQQQFVHDQEKLKNDFSNQLAKARQDYEMQLVQMKQAILEYEKNLNLMVDEVERLTSLVDSKEQEVGICEAKLNSLEKKKEQELDDLRVWAEKDKKIAVEKESKGLMNTFNSEKAALDAKLNDADHKISELQDAIMLLTVELEKLGALCEDQEEEAEMWKQKYSELDNTRYFEIEEMRTQVETIKRNSLGAEDYEIRLQAERAAFETQIMQLKQKVRELDTQIGDLKRDSERVNILYNEKKREIESLKNSQGQIEYGAHEELISLRKENDHLKKAIAETEENLTTVRFNKTSYESQVDQLKQALDLHKIEITKLHDMMNSRKAEHDSLMLETTTLKEENDRISKQHKDLQGEYLKLVSSYEHLYREVEDYKNSRDSYKVQFDQNNLDIAKKNKELIDKIHQVDALKAKYEEAIANVEPIKSTSKIVTKMSIKR